MSVAAIDHVRTMRIKLTGTERLVMGELAWRADPSGGMAWPSIGQIAQATQRSRRAVLYALRSLRDRKLIKPTGRKSWGSVIYRIVGVPRIRRSDPVKVQDQHRQSAESAPYKSSKDQTTSSSRAVRRAWAKITRGSVVVEEPNDQTPDLRKLAEMLCEQSGIRVNAGERRKLISRLCEALSAGHEPESLRSILGTLGGARSQFAVAMYRLGQMDPPKADIKPQGKPRCGRCDENRMIELADGPARCPNCHPLASQKIHRFDPAALPC